MIEYDQRMLPDVRTICQLPPDPRCQIVVVGHRVRFSEAVRGPPHPEWFLVLVHHPAWIGTRDGLHEVPAGTFLAVPPGMPVVHRPCGRLLERTWIRAAGTRIGEAVAEAGLEPGVPVVLTEEPPLAGFDELHRVVQRFPPPSALHQAALVRAWLHGLAQAAGMGQERTDGIAAVRRHLDAAWRSPHRLDDLARRAGLSRSQLCRAFRARYGTSPMDHAMGLRLDHARDLLESTGLTVEEVSTACRFTDRAHLARHFRQRFGLTPAAHRRSMGWPRTEPV